MEFDESSGPVVRVHVALTFEEYRRANRHFRTKGKSSGSGFIPFLCLLWFGLLISLALVDNDLRKSWSLWLAIIGSASAVVFGLLRSWQATDAARKWWDSCRDLVEPADYIFSPAGVQIAYPYQKITMNWKFIVAAEKSESAAFLISLTGAAYILPERAFASEEDRRTFQQLVEAMVPNCKL